MVALHFVVYTCPIHRVCSLLNEKSNQFSFLIVPYEVSFTCGLVGEEGDDRADDVNRVDQPEPVDRPLLIHLFFPTAHFFLRRLMSDVSPPRVGAQLRQLAR